MIVVVVITAMTEFFVPRSNDFVPSAELVEALQHRISAQAKPDIDVPTKFDRLECTLFERLPVALNAAAAARFFTRTSSCLVFVMLAPGAGTLDSICCSANGQRFVSLPKSWVTRALDHAALCSVLFVLLCPPSENCPDHSIRFAGILPHVASLQSGAISSEMLWRAAGAVVRHNSSLLLPRSYVIEPTARLCDLLFPPTQCPQQFAMSAPGLERCFAPSLQLAALQQSFGVVMDVYGAGGTVLTALLAWLNEFVVWLLKLRSSSFSSAGGGGTLLPSTLSSSLCTLGNVRLRLDACFYLLLVGVVAPIQQLSSANEQSELLTQLRNAILALLRALAKRYFSELLTPATARLVMGMPCLKYLLSVSSCMLECTTENSAAAAPTFRLSPVGRIPALIASRRFPIDPQRLAFSVHWSQLGEVVDALLPRALDTLLREVHQSSSTDPPMIQTAVARYPQLVAYTQVMCDQIRSVLMAPRIAHTILNARGQPIRLPDIENLMRDTPLPLCAVNSLSYLQHTQHLFHYSLLQLLRSLFDMGYTDAQINSYLRKHVPDANKLHEYELQVADVAKQLMSPDWERKASCQMMMSTRFTDDSGDECSRGCPFKLASDTELVRLLSAAGLGDDDDRATVTSIVQTALYNTDGKRHPKAACWKHATARIRKRSGREPPRTGGGVSRVDDKPFHSPAGHVHYVLMYCD